MLVDGKHYKTIWLSDKNYTVLNVIDQRWLPHRFEIIELKSVEEVALAISDMIVRGAGLIGVTAAYGMYLAAIEARLSTNAESKLSESASRLIATRPTAVNLQWAVERQLAVINAAEESNQVEVALATALEIAHEDEEACHAIGIHGVEIIRKIARRTPGQTINVLTHCNAGWLAFTDYGTATAPIYQAASEGIDIHVWVDETRPRNQGAQLTAWELGQQGIPHSIISDNTGGHLMQHGEVDLVITGADRVTKSGDVANKIGTYLKALAAMDNSIPFYVAFPSSTIDWSIIDGILEIPIEERSAEEVKHVQGLLDGKIEQVLIAPQSSPAVNIGFDVTPARLISGLITEKGICEASQEGLINMFQK